ncbi:hypothetical protein DOTSEDRAFT_69916 [Dothistroma septosporum NZE10]|uniref:Uncharacterized protein n=1 Tax=Dothistroma septosporum (strain NZE10 / CBS 128990) TaxID=675120 RepID=N1Q0I5_DOTSN|nr:hypothetical protein DOTSEDRAFT_69916 [Dothistroma septosporum NZE10]
MLCHAISPSQSHSGSCATSFSFSSTLRVALQSDTFAVRKVLRLCLLSAPSRYTVSKSVGIAAIVWLGERPRCVAIALRFFQKQCPTPFRPRSAFISKGSRRCWEEARSPPQAKTTLLIEVLQQASAAAPHRGLRRRETHVEQIATRPDGRSAHSPRTMHLQEPTPNR